MSTINQARENGRIPYTGTCRGCGTERTATLPAKEEFVCNNVERFRCNNCGTINSLSKASET